MNVAASLPALIGAAPSIERLVAVDESGTLLAAAGGAVDTAAGPAVIRLWTTALRAAANRSPAPLDHLVLRTTVGDAVVLRTEGCLLAAAGREGTRPDRVAYELRRAVADLEAGAAADPATEGGR